MPEFKQSLLLSLAPEVIQVITDELTIETIKDLRLTCKQLGEFLNTRVFRELTINFSQDTFENDLSKVRFLATTDCHAASSVTRTLKVASLSPLYAPGYLGGARQLVDGEWVQEPIPKVLPEMVVAAEELKGYLFKAITSLRGIQSVVWEPRRKDDEWAQETVMNALKTLPNLHALLLPRIDHFNIPLPLHDLPAIYEFSIAGTGGRYHAEILDNLAKLAARTPNITSIAILSGSFSKRHSLHQIFKYYPKGSAPLRLRHLSFKTCLVKLDNITLPHLQHLTSLSLLDIDDPYDRSSYWGSQEPSELEYTEKLKKFGSSRDDFWNALKFSRIQLEELTLDFVVPSFLEYLASYSGLKKLHLIADEFLNGSSSDSMAIQFFSTPFTNHVQSLENLKIIAPYEGHWCFGQHNLAVISRCESLKTLEMAIISGQLYTLPGTENLEDIGAERNVVERFVDTVSKFMPRLESLVISATRSEQLRRATSGTPARSHFHRTVLDIFTSIHHYRALPTYHRLPHLTVNNRSGFVRTFTFVSGGLDKYGRLRYSMQQPSHSG